MRSIVLYVARLRPRLPWIVRLNRLILSFRGEHGYLRLSSEEARPWRKAWLSFPRRKKRTPIMEVPPLDVTHSSVSVGHQKMTTRRRSRTFRRLLPIYLFILPAISLFFLWSLYPMLDALVMSLFQWNPNLTATSPFNVIATYMHA